MVRRTNGTSAEKIAALPNYRNSELFSGTEKLVLEYADGMTQTPVEVPDALFAKLREKFTDAQLVELTATLAWENYRARFDHAFGVEAEGLRRELLRDAGAGSGKGADTTPLKKECALNLVERVFRDASVRKRKRREDAA